MKSRLITATAVIALSANFAAPAFAQFLTSETPIGYTDDGWLNVFGARIEPRTVDAFGWGDRAGPVVNGPAAGYGVPAY